MVRPQRPRPQLVQVVDVVLAPVVVEARAAEVMALRQAVAHRLRRAVLLPVAAVLPVQVLQVAVLPVVAADAPLVPQRPSIR